MSVSTIFQGAKRISNDTYMLNNTVVHAIRTDDGALSMSFQAHGIYWRLLALREKRGEFTHELVELSIPAHQKMDGEHIPLLSKTALRRDTDDAYYTNAVTLVCPKDFTDYTVCCPSSCETCVYDPEATPSNCVITNQDVSCETNHPPCWMVAEHRVTVAYTRVIRESGVNIRAIVDLAIKESNMAYVLSRIPVKLVLADLYESDVADGSDSYVMLNDFRARRDVRSGHFAILLTQNVASCGRAYVDCTSYDPRSVLCGFGVVRLSCATGYYSFAHEIGHIQGLDHNEPFNNPNSRFDDNHGYVSTPGLKEDGAVRTIMSYAVVDELRIPYFSNPNVVFDRRLQLGEKNKANNARVMTFTRYDVTRLNPGLPSPTTSPSFQPTRRPTKKPTKMSRRERLRLQKKRREQRKKRKQQQTTQGDGG